MRLSFRSLPGQEGHFSLEHAHSIATDACGGEQFKASPNMTFKMNANADSDASRAGASINVAAEKRRKKKNTLESKKENDSPAKETVSFANVESVASENYGNNGDTMKIVLPKRFNATKERKEVKGKVGKTASQGQVVFNAVDTKSGDIRRGSNHSNGEASQRNVAPPSQQQQPPQHQQIDNATPNPSNVFSSFFAPQYYGPPFLANPTYSSTHADQDSYLTHSSHSKTSQQQSQPLQQIPEQQSWSYPFALQVQQHLGVSPQSSSFYLPPAFSHSSAGANASNKASQVHAQVYANNNNNVNNLSPNHNENHADQHGGLLPMDGIFSGRFYANVDEKKFSGESGLSKPSRASKRNNHN